jgi:hypothetical protein
MTPRRAARRFVREMTAFVFGDFLDLMEPGGETDHSFERIEKAIRRRLGITKQDTLALRQAVIDAVPKEHRKATQEAANHLSDAETEALLVRENAAYLVGIEVGRTLQGKRPRKKEPQHGGPGL